MNQSSSRPSGGSATELMRNAVASIRWKMMMMVAFSGAFAVGGVLSLLLLAQLMWRIGWVKNTLTYLTNRGWAIPMILITGVVLFIASFVLLTTGMMRYLSGISRGVNQIAAGDLDTYIPVKGHDELARLAGNINQMVARIRKSIEEERESERSKYELVTSVSHDLRTPLTSILGYLELVDGDKYQDEIQMRHYVSIAHEKAKGLKRLIDDLFEFTRVNYGGMTVRKETVNLGTLLEQLTEEFVPILEQAGMEYRLSLPPDKVNVEADPSLLVRVFENLMSNAVRYGSDGHYVDVELNQSSAAGEVVAGGPAAGWAVVRIANYGAPIPENQVACIFERFVRVEESRSRDTGGAGLGLAIAKSIVELHGGTIRAYNEADRTVFEVQFPISLG